MRHRVAHRKLGRKTAHRKALKRNMLTSFFRYERIKTTRAKALEIRSSAEKMITRAKIDSVHNRRQVASVLFDKAVVAKLFTDIGPKYKERNGGYTRILKLGQRQGDAADMVILELVEEEEKKESGTKAKKAKAPAKKASTSSKKTKAEAKPAKKAEKPAEEKAEAASEEKTEEVVEETVEASAEVKEEKTEE
jgi:large subunit ribosomal protein L17